MVDTPRDEQSRIEPVIRFVGEQDGVPESDLKSKLADGFATEPGVSAAYLSRVQLGEDRTPTVLLAIRSSDPERHAEVVKQVNSTFSAMFNGAQFLDIAFINAVEEDRVKLVCRAFFSRTP
jgi:hypothetical protein